ncbi:MAG: hypothetical protein ACT4O0_03140 [Pseudonocardia sp.]
MPPDERELIETVASYLNMTVSDFSRQILRDTATAIVNDVGMDKMLHAINERNEARAASREAAVRAAAAIRSAR